MIKLILNSFIFLASTVIILLFFCYSEAAPYPLAHFNGDFALSVCINLLVSSFVGLICFDEGKRAERGETNFVTSILSDLDQKVTLSNSANKNLKKLNPDDHDKISSSIAKFDKLPWEQLRSSCHLSTDHTGKFIMPVGEYRIGFLHTDGKFFIIDVLDKRRM